MNSKSEIFYTSLFDDCKETSTMFRFIPIFFKEKISSILFYLSLIFVATAIELYFPTYFISYFISFIVIAEHRRVILTRETVLEMCMIDEIYYNWEAEENSEFLNSIGMNYELSDSDRCRYFYERLSYVDCINPLVYMKRHYKFLFCIVALQLFLYGGILIYSVV